MDKPIDDVMQALIEVAVGKVQHLYRGTCPDAIEGFDSRDPQCPACRVLTAAQQQQGQGGWEVDEVVCLACGDHIMPMGQVCYACSHPASAPPSAPVGVDMPAIWHRLGWAEGAVAGDWRVLVREARESIETLWKAQQPAAVDESFVERFCGRWFQLTGRSLDRPTVRACFAEALAAQPQEPTT